ncbi:hypothetical protein DSO57_1029542 [Entomophthora muscae]|uniref:Uncharacterized protein n=1 Tax=Entomophthora muscae TaxID=34485 RepID=A0ACC2TZM5_9FUNG|nr:hypothetical protein DSO57_1029542 [Entomophthora muscae]
MADGHTYTLDCQEVAHCHSCNKPISCGSVPTAYPIQETADQPPKFYYPPGAPFGPVHFTKYPTNPVYLKFTLEEILIYNPEARTRETETIYREGTKITIPPLLFCNKYNYLPTYLVPMKPPLTPQPNCLQESVAANEFTSTQIFGVMYITLTGLIDSMHQSCGGPFLLGPQAVRPQVPKNPPQAGSLKYPHRLWASDIALCITGAASHFVSELVNQHPDHREDWDMFKAAFLKKFAIKDYNVVIMTELRTFKMTGTIEEYIAAYKDLHD